MSTNLRIRTSSNMPILPNLPNRTLESHQRSTILTGWGANCWVKNGHDKVNIQISIKISMKMFYESYFTKTLAVKSCSNLNQSTKYRLSKGNGHISKSATEKLKYGHWTTHKPSSVATQTKLGCYVATELAPLIFLRCFVNVFSLQDSS